MKKEYQKNKKTALILWGLCFILFIIFRVWGNSFFTFLFGILSLVFLVIASIYKFRIREIDAIESAEFARQLKRKKED